MIATDSILIEEFKNQFSNTQNPVFSEEKRREAWAVFEEKGLPSKKSEEYKYAPITRLLEKNFERSIPAQSEAEPVSAANISHQFISGAEGYRIVMINGLLNEELSDFPDSIKLKNINSLSSGDLFDSLGKYASPNDDPFIALNTALVERGLGFCISKNTILEKPVYVYNFTDTTNAQLHHQVRNVIILEENSQAKIIMINKGLGEKTAFINEVNEVLIHPYANLQWVRLEDEPEKCFHINNTKIWQEKSSHLHTVSITLAGGLIRNNLTVALNGEGCESHLYGLYMIGGKSIVDNHTVVDHRKPNSNSNELYKGILSDRSKGVFNGKVYVRPDAQKTNAFQSNQNILLSPDAVVNTKPQLEIWADDVKCSHGCTTGQLNEDAIFYLRARGISKQKAKALLLQAFAGEILEQIKLPEVKAFMEAYVNDKLGV